jgi:hypothetical protein
MNLISLGLLVFLITCFTRRELVFGFKLQKIYIGIHSGCNCNGMYRFLKSPNRSYDIYRQTALIFMSTEKSNVP